MNKLIDRYAVVFVAVAATLWATDAYFRNQLVQHLSPTQIVVAEDALVTLFLLPVLIRSRGELRKLGPRGGLAVAIIAAGAQALATILFTASFSIAAQHQLFAETVVLQQTQPLIAILLARAVVGARRGRDCWPGPCAASAGGPGSGPRRRSRLSPSTWSCSRATRCRRSPPCRTDASRSGCSRSAQRCSGPAARSSAALRWDRSRSGA